MDIPEDKTDLSASNALASIGDYTSSSENEDEHDLGNSNVESTEIQITKNACEKDKKAIITTEMEQGPIVSAHMINGIDEDKNIHSDSFQMMQSSRSQQPVESSGLIASDSSDSSSSSSSEDEDSSSESETPKDEKDSALESDEEPDTPKSKGINNKQRNMMKVKGEFLNSDLPPIEDLHITVPEFECVPLGKISSIVDDLVVVKAHPNTAALDLESVLFLEKGKRPLGKVFDVIGPVASPFYCVRFNSTQHIKDKDITVESEVYCAPRTEHTSFVFVEQLRKMKGSDASWKDDIEPQREQQDFSDDEEERAARRTRNKLFQKQDDGIDCSSNDSGIPQDTNNPGDSKQGQRKILKAKRAYKPPSSGQQSNNAFYRNTKRFNPRQTGPVRWNSVPSRSNYGNAQPGQFHSNSRNTIRSAQPSNSESLPYNQFHAQHTASTLRPQMVPMEFSRPPPIRPSLNYNQGQMYHGEAPRVPATPFPLGNNPTYMQSQLPNPIYSQNPYNSRYENCHFETNNHHSFPNIPVPDTTPFQLSSTPSIPPNNENSQNGGRIPDHFSNEENLLPPGT